ncbi:helix-turn-helix domain-containing protein [Actinomadura sp. NPDC047616]|uniref:TetR/AcrR family transcriptional regulator n=1 Tax=Actinomadura sp. NPDC047616 TaxID=3155914 RepID=UPI0033FDB57A
MDDGTVGLRERKKRRTRKKIADTAIGLFLEHGYEPVSLAQIAEAAEVSRRALFAYFPSKEDLVLERVADHESEHAQVVRGRPPEVPPLAALRDHFLDGLDRRDPVTGLCDRPETLALYRMIRDTPALATGLLRYHARSEAALAEALAEAAGAAAGAGPDAAFTARLTASQITAVQRVLANDNNAHLVAGTSADERHPAAVAAARHAFTLLRDGLGGVFG